MTNAGLFIIRAPEAATILNVSVEYLRKLSQTDKCPFHGHPDFFREDVILAYKEQRDAELRKELKELVAMTTYGGYDDESDVDEIIYDLDRDRLIDERVD